MESKRQVSLPRQMSFNSMSPIKGLGQWKRLLCLGILFILGIICGHFIHLTFMSRKNTLFSRHRAVDRPLNYRQARRHVDSSDGRPGLSLKKDMSIQFRDYIPRLLFINCGGTLPRSVKLFQDTYPNSHQYVIYSFITDVSYAPLYAQFSNHFLFAPLACASSNGTMTAEMETFASNRKKNVTVPTFDLALWIKTTTHPDEHIILKLDVDGNTEKRITERIMETEVLEWIDQFYTTTMDTEIVNFEKKKFSARPQDVLFWDDRGNYSDFFKQNPPKLPPVQSNVIRKCRDAAKSYHSVILYSSRMSLTFQKTLSLLAELRKTFPDKLPMTLCLPYDFVISYPGRLSSLFTILDVGAYVSKSYPPGMNMTDDERYFKLRNILVAIENRFKQSDGLLQNVLVRNDVYKTYYEKLIAERHYNIIVKTVDITHLRWADFRNVPKMPVIPDSQIISVDIGEENADLLVLYLFQQFGYKILPLDDCLKAKDSS